MGRPDQSWAKAVIPLIRWVFCGLDTVHVLSAFRHDYGIVFFCLDPSGQSGLVGH